MGAGTDAADSADPSKEGVFVGVSSFAFVMVSFHFLDYARPDGGLLRSDSASKRENGIEEICPQPRLVESASIGRRSTSLTNVTINESWVTIEVPPIIGVCDYYHDKSYALPGQAPLLGFNL